MLWVPASVTHFSQNDFFYDQPARAQKTLCSCSRARSGPFNPPFCLNYICYICGNVTINCEGTTVCSLMSVQLNRDHTQAQQGPIKPTEYSPIDTVSSLSPTQVLNQQSMFLSNTSQLRIYASIIPCRM